MKAVGNHPLDSLPPLRDIIREHGLRAEKSLGQNFILDQNLTDKIVRAAGDLSGVHVFEIGPGPGGLTRSILRACPKHLTAIEYDSRAIEALGSLKEVVQNQLTLVQNDALKVHLPDLAPQHNRAIIANLPYNIATPLLLKWLREIRADNGIYENMTLMFQREVAERIVATPRSKSYGRLSVISQWLCDVEIVFDLPPTAFVPPPKVTSSVVRFRPKTTNKDWPEFERVERVTASAFGQRRKMIRQSLKEYIDSIRELGIDETVRAEDLSVEEYVDLAKLCSLD